MNIKKKLNITNLFISKDSTIKNAMRKLGETAEKCLLVVDNKNKLIGTLTDGDIRRSILSSKKFSEDISSSYNSKPTKIIKSKFSNQKAKRLLKELKIDLIPITNKNDVVVDYITWSSLGNRARSFKSIGDVPVVIMAGGRGARLKPFTNILPKPLVPINDKPIIEHIIERFSKVGCNDFILTVNYKAQILKAYFDELQKLYKVSFIDEKTPLGTAGSLGLIDFKFNKPFFVTNCDIIIKSNYTNIYEFHLKGNYDVTIVASTKEYIIPYGACEINEDGLLSHINEKPAYEFLINTGLYILNPEILELIPKNKFFHITHLIEKAKNKGLKVGVFPIDDSDWIDVGQWKEYHKAIENF